jgi:hypothetical protein
MRRTATSPKGTSTASRPLPGWPIRADGGRPAPSITVTVEVAEGLAARVLLDQAAGAELLVGDLGVAVPEQLHTQQPPGGAVTGEAHRDPVTAEVVGLMVIGLGLDSDRVEPGGFGFVVAQPGAGGGLVEDLRDLGAEAARELPGPAERVLPGDPALLGVVVPSGR